MIAVMIAGLLALASGIVLIVGLMALIRLMARISEALTSVRILTATVVGATEHVDEHVRGIGTNVSGILEEAEGIAAFVATLSEQPPTATSGHSLASDTPAPDPQELT
ncbi:hypothetical protein ACIA03_23430 [Nocardioides sp. NPDC051685]|uniref:hypothetical protein n=1 Tax=Nocardioides sp. NPDC051685 TaxID=3364334 RepID=UPI0037B96B99